MTVSYKEKKRPTQTKIAREYSKPKTIATTLISQGFLALFWKKKYCTELESEKKGKEKKKEKTFSWTNDTSKIRIFQVSG